MDDQQHNHSWPLAGIFRTTSSSNHNVYFPNFSCSFCCRSEECDMLDFVKILVAILVVYLVYYSFTVPANFQRDLSDVGFNYLKDNSYKSVKHKKRSKRELVREVQALRKIGELPPVYPNGWFALVESEELKKESVLHVTALGENFAVFRSAQGVVHVLDAYCPHLGANMAVGGIVRDNCLECPFHNWQFDGDSGACTSVPYSEGKTPEFVKVKSWQCVEVNGFVFVWHHAEGIEPEWVPEEREVIRNGSWRFHGRSEFLVSCHIQEIPENGADVAHLNAIHKPNLLSGHDLRHCERPLMQFMHHYWTAQWRQCEREGEGHKGIMDLTFETKLFDALTFGRMIVTVEQIGPAYVELNLDTMCGPMLLLQTVTPVEPMLQKVVHRVYSSPITAWPAKFVLYAEMVMFGRDVMVWNHKKYLSKPQLVKEDKTISRHRRWYNQFYTENSPRFSFQKDTMEW